MRILSAVLVSLTCLLIFTTHSFGRNGSIAVESVEAVVEQSSYKPKDHYTVYVDVLNEAEDYETVIVKIWLFRKYTGEEVYSDYKTVKIESGRNRIEFSFDKNIDTGHIDYKVVLQSRDGDMLFNTEKDILLIQYESP